MPETGDQLSEIGDQVLSRLEMLNTAREQALAETRRIVRLCANSIRATHRQDFTEAEGLLRQAREMLHQLSDELDEFPSIYWSGYVRDAQKEFAEASIVLAMKADRGWPSPDDLAVEDAVFLNGLGESAGEFRRAALDAMRRGDLVYAERMLELMDNIYSLLVTVDYPDAVTGGLRRTNDMVRGVLERTRGDLTVALKQQELTVALERFETKLGKLD